MLQPNYMENGFMFAMLLEYAEEDFCKEHPVIRFDTLEKEGKYEAPAAFYGKAYRVKDKNVFRYYNYTDLTDPADFDEYLDFVAGASLYETGVTAEYGDQLLTLITCSYNTTDGRFVVVAREILVQAFHLIRSRVVDKIAEEPDDFRNRLQRPDQRAGKRLCQNRFLALQRIFSLPSPDRPR